MDDNIRDDVSDVKIEPEPDREIIQPQPQPQPQTQTPTKTKPTPQSRIDHSKNITNKRRRNNIYGELTDPIAIAFLEAGGDGLLYGIDRSWLYGVAEAAEYVLVANPTPFLDESVRQKLIDRASVMTAVPLIVVQDRTRVKFYDIKGKQVRYI